MSSIRPADPRFAARRAERALIEELRAASRDDPVAVHVQADQLVLEPADPVRRAVLVRQHQDARPSHRRLLPKLGHPVCDPGDLIVWIQSAPVGIRTL